MILKSFVSKLAACGGAVAAAALFAPGIANASFILDTGTPTASAATTLGTNQWLAAEFSTSGSELIDSVSAYLNQGAGQPGDTFTIDLYANSGFTNRNTSRPAALDTATGTFSANGWNTTSINNWAALSAGTYWLALQVSSTNQTKGLSATEETGTGTGTAPAGAFAYTTSAYQYLTSGALPFGVQVDATPVPLPAALWLLGSGVAGIGALRRKLA
jgi:hypothetical protein